MSPEEKLPEAIDDKGNDGAGVHFVEGTNSYVENHVNPRLSQYLRRQHQMQNKENILIAEYHRRKKELGYMWKEQKQPRSYEEAFLLFVRCILSSRTNWNRVVSVTGQLQKNGLLFTGDMSQLTDAVRSIGGKVDHKARAAWILEDRKTFPIVFWLIDSLQKGSIVLSSNGLSAKDILCQEDPQLWIGLLQRRGITPEALRSVVKQLKGAGDKQASHFLASLGFEGYAVIDTYILEKLVEFKLISKKPDNVSSNHYHSIETQMKNWCNSIGIPLHFLDMLWWRDRHK